MQILADDCIVYHPIHDASDQQFLQQDKILYFIGAITGK